MLITRYCNLIGTANIPAVHTKTYPNTPDVFFPSPLFGARNIRARAKYVGLARLGSQYVAQLRGAARCLRRFVNTQPRTNRAAPRRAARIEMERNGREADRSLRCFPCLWQTMSKAQSVTTSKSLKSLSTSIVTLFSPAVAPIRKRGYKGCGRRTSRSQDKHCEHGRGARRGASRRAA